MRFRTGVQQLDSALRGGIPAGVCEVFGEDSSGKSTLCFSLMREASIAGLPFSLIHSECYPDEKYIKNCGVPDCLSVIPAHLEAAFKATRSLISRGVKLVVIDSLTGLECLEDFNNHNVGERARFAKSKSVLLGLGELYDYARSNNALIVVTNQLRTPIGSINPKPTSALHRVIGQVTNTRIQTYKEQVRNEYGELAYAKILFRIKKSLKSPPNVDAWGFLFNQRGFDPGFELVREFINQGYLVSAGAYFRLPDGSTVGPGYEKAALQVNQKLSHYRSMYETLSGP